MFEFIFGWRKASKCKKLIRKVQCRLKLLKNKRCCIVRQLRNDVAQLIKDGHYQTAFNRTDQIYKDECIVAVYDLLATFCEFISHELPYIRQHKDCPNDINEAISSLIFASARCGDLPELRLIRKLFSERYGERFEATALNLLPGNLVNFLIRENLSIKLVPKEMKYKLVEEIATSVLQSGPLALEFASEQHQQQANKSNANQFVQDTKIEQIGDVDFSSNQVDFDYFMVNKDQLIPRSTKNVPEKVTYLDDIEEFRSPLKKDENGQDQSVFVFKSSAIVPVVENNKKYQFSDFNISQSSKRLVLTDIESNIYYNNTFHRQRSNLEKIKYEGTVKELYPHMRALTMPCERIKKHLDDNVVMRSNSFPVQPTSPHVHPKLPDYDELAAKFNALKRENLENKK